VDHKLGEVVKLNRLSIGVQMQLLLRVHLLNSDLLLAYLRMENKRQILLEQLLMLRIDEGLNYLRS